MTEALDCRSHRVVFLAVLLWLIAPLATKSVTAAEQTPEQALATLLDNKGDGDAKQRLDELLDIAWSWQVEQFPEFATYAG